MGEAVESRAFSDIAVTVDSQIQCYRPCFSRRISTPALKRDQRTTIDREALLNSSFVTVGPLQEPWTHRASREHRFRPSGPFHLAASENPANGGVSRDTGKP